MAIGHELTGCRQPFQRFFFEVCVVAVDKIKYLGLQHKALGEKTFWHVRLGIVDPHRFILENYALKSPCEKTITLAREEYTVRYGVAA